MKTPVGAILKRGKKPSTIEESCMVETTTNTSSSIHINGTLTVSNSIIELTYADAVKLKTAKGVYKGGIYFILDKNIFLTGFDDSTFSTTGTFKAYNVDWQSTKVTMLGVWTASLTPSAGNYVTWNNEHYRNTTGSNGAFDPSSDTTNWALVSRPHDSYVIEYDEIIYDFENDKITSRRDKRGNVVIDKEAWPGNSINKFQWGRNTVIGNYIHSFGYIGWNAIRANQQMYIQDSAVTINESGWLDYCIIIGRSTVIMSGTAAARATTINNANLTMSGATTLNNGNLENFATLNLQDTSNGSTSVYRNCNITMTGTSAIAGCLIDGRNQSISKTFATENATGKRFVRWEDSTFVKDLTIASTDTTLTVDSGNFYGICNLTITGGTASITSVTNITEGTKIRIYPLTNNLTLVHGASLKIKGAANKTFNTTNGDWVELANFSSVVKEYNSGQY